MASFDAIDLLLRYETPLVKDMEPEDDVLEWVAAYVGSESFQESINNFCSTHASHFSILLTKGGPSAADLDKVEQTWKELHEAFIDTANASIEAFLSTRGFTMDQYHSRCNEEIALSEERQRHTRLSFLVQILMACCEYEQFLNLMKRVADPEYYDKKELQFEAENLVYEAEEKGEINAQQAAGAQAFLDFFQANPNLTLDELTQEFEKKLQLT
ncbi:ADP-ribosylation factor-like 2-binding protein, domain [Plasmopara halstedii]|uniref:Cilia- and flagella-associated protein 36 n=1 Tax=Plasmopara halstedii TaxID=4781 RepID=A0A0P1A967_PLAHL|nr:ADP-ribosylation factor-like 2-binding protein, domain [Plasmopara halstedii]CEG36920.1 ADP-ribosylation factor-like 2-binding protein, domain [Plasmopara halstedii]|eukprot:XP_024573289.1 ADP-ribosylation factor-like 2-binding protein, domain [Plasmopara halstedii]